MALANLAYATIYTISDTTTLSTTSYSQSPTDSWLIETNAALLLPNINNLRAGNNFLNYGDFITACQIGSSVRIDWIMNMESGMMSITSAAGINFQSFATVNNWGTWTMTSLAGLTVSLSINGYTFTNAGTVVWTSNSNTQISLIRPLVNTGDFTLKSTIRASYSYGQITNTGNMKMMSKANTDTISISNAFSNSGYFTNEYGLNPIYACLSSP